MKHRSLRNEIITTARQFILTDMGVGTSGNLSARTDSGFLITPTGVQYTELEPVDIVELDKEGVVIDSKLKPSSEWWFHCAIYKRRPQISAIVHVHSPYATAIACTRQDIPAFHYLVALAGGDSIRCAEYATFGTEELSRNALDALDNRMACLLANHGMIALGHDINSAFNMAREVEMLARQYCLSMQAGGPVLLDEDEMNTNLGKFTEYGK